MEPIVLNPVIYVLELEEGKVYVGITLNFNLRLAQHMTGQGANWTKRYKPVRVLEILHENATRDLETVTTIRYMAKYGVDNVRGGPYTQEILSAKIRETVANLRDSPAKI